MRPWIWIALMTGCGQMYPASGSSAAPPPASETLGAPGATEPLPAAPMTAAPETADRVAPDAPPSSGAASAAARKPKPARRTPAPSGDAEAFLAAHNEARAKHCAAPLTWSPKLAQLAQQWANSLRDKGCQFGHSGGSTGENLAAGTSGTLDPEAVVKMWYDEVSLYKFPNGGFSMKTGHFTQVVWRGTKQVGCGRSQCKGMDIWVCEYDPPGNWERQYRENVLPVGC
jgi:uncharacterized protein YkwD